MTPRDYELIIISLVAQDYFTFGEFYFHNEIEYGSRTDSNHGVHYQFQSTIVDFHYEIYEL